MQIVKEHTETASKKDTRFKTDIVFQHAKDALIKRATRHRSSVDIKITVLKYFFFSKTRVYTESADISISGVKILAPVKIDIGQSLELCLQNRSTKEKIVTLAKVVRVRETLLSNNYHIYEIGIRFSGLTDRKKTRLDSWISATPAIK